MKQAGVQVLTILGREYTFRASSNEESTLQQAANLLNKQLEANRQNFPTVSHQELLILTALNLCVPLLQNSQQEDCIKTAEQRLTHCIDLISQQLDKA